MPRSKPAWDYANSSGYWVGTPSEALRAAVATACDDLPSDIVERLIERGQVLGGALRVYEDEHEQSPSCGAETLAAKRIAADAAALAAKLPRMGGIQAEVQSQLLDAGASHVDLITLRDNLEHLAEAAHVIEANLANQPKGDKRRRSPELSIALKFADEYERIVGERPTRWIADGRDDGAASRFVKLLMAVLNEFGRRRRTLSAVDDIAKRALSDR